jgi:hypothetical protein
MRWWYDSTSIRCWLRTKNRRVITAWSDVPSGIISVSFIVSLKKKQSMTELSETSQGSTIAHCLADPDHLFSRMVKHHRLCQMVKTTLH